LNANCDQAIAKYKAIMAQYEGFVKSVEVKKADYEVRIIILKKEAESYTKEIEIKNE
jgi:hypothetical protein